jgi:hypothetical protein
MTDQQFWDILNPVAAIEDVDDRIRAVISQLNGMPDDLLAGFRNQLYRKLHQLCTADLYGAGVLLTGRKFDDEYFELFRCLILLKSQQCFEAAQTCADGLARFTFSEQEKELAFEGEMLLFSAHFAYQERHDYDTDLDEVFPPQDYPDLEIQFQFQSTEKMREQYPQLWPLRRAMVPPKESAPEL